MGNIKGFIFDMDGVITETSENHYMAWKMLASSIGIYIDRSLNEALKGISRMASLEVILKHGGRENDFTESEKLMLATTKNNNYVKMIEKFDESNVLEGMLEFFLELRSRGIKIAVASASKSAGKLLELMKLNSLVDYIVDPSTVPGKPAPDIFLKAAEGIGLKPIECIGVEDAIAGITSIKSAGMFAVGIGDLDKLSEADIVYKKPKDMDLEAILKLYEM